MCQVQVIYVFYGQLGQYYVGLVQGNVFDGVSVVVGDLDVDVVDGQLFGQCMVDFGLGGSDQGGFVYEWIFVKLWGKFIMYWW